MLAAAAERQELDVVLSEAERAYGISADADLVVTSFKAQALRIRGYLDAALNLLETTADSAHRGGIQLLLAETLLIRGSEERSQTRLRDCLRALELALEVRDQRRRWGGDSGAATVIAVQAAAALDDWPKVKLIGSTEATEFEASMPEVSELVMFGMLAEGADEVEVSTSRPSGRAWLRGLHLGGREEQHEEAISAFVDSVEAAENTRELERGLRGLAALGHQPLPRLDELASVNPSHAASLEGLARYRADPSDDSLGSLRIAANEARMGAGFLVMIEVERGNFVRASQLALDAARRFGDATFAVQAVAAVLDADPVLAAQIARAELDSLPQEAPQRIELRRALLQLAMRSGDPTEVETTAIALLDEGPPDSRAEWLVVEARCAQGREEAAWQWASSRGLQPESEREARLFLVSHARGAPSSSTAAVDVLDDFSWSHDVLATGLLLFFTTRASSTSEAIGHRYGAHLQRFTSEFPESSAIRGFQVDTDSPDAAIAQLRAQLPPYDPSVHEAMSQLHEHVALGLLPFGACAAALGRNTHTLACVGRHASVPHVSRDDAFAAQVDLATKAIDAEVVLDASVLELGSLVPDAWQTMTSVVARGVVVTSQVTELRAFAHQRPAVGHVASEAEGIRLSDVDEADASAIERRSEWMLQCLDGMPREQPPLGPPITALRDIEEEGSWAHALHLAAATDRILVADDPALVALAADSGIAAIGSLALATGAAQTGRLPADALSSLIVNLTAASVVDLPLTAEGHCAALEAAGWPLEPCLTVLSRADFWLRPSAVIAHHLIATKLADLDRSSLPSIAAAVVIGVARALPGEAATGFVGGVVAQLILVTRVQADELPELVRAARSAWRHDTDVAPAVLRSLTEILLESVDVNEARALLADLGGQLSPEDRAIIDGIVAEVEAG